MKSIFIYIYKFSSIILHLYRYKPQPQHQLQQHRIVILRSVVYSVVTLVVACAVVVVVCQHSNYTNSITDIQYTYPQSIIDSTKKTTTIIISTIIYSILPLTRLAVSTTRTTIPVGTRTTNTVGTRTVSIGVTAWITTTTPSSLSLSSSFRILQKERITGPRTRYPRFDIPRRSSCSSIVIYPLPPPIGISTSIFLQPPRQSHLLSQEVPLTRLYDTDRTSHANTMENTSSSTVPDDKIIDGKQIAATIREEIRLAVVQRMAAQLPVPGLAVILVGQRRDSQTYVNMKKKACKEAGIISVGYDFNDTVTEEELLTTIQELNHSSNVHGILIQLPLPKHLNQDTILRAVDPTKDVDGLHPINTAALQLYQEGNAMDAPFSIPCTPLGCLELLDRSGVELSGKHCVVIGRSQLVGLPMARLLLGRNATVTICHSKTTNPAALVSQADVVVVAIGRAQHVTADWIKPGAVVIDVGINSIDVVVDDDANDTTTKKKASYKLVGDVHYEDCYAKCSKITPVPGGVGPMTIAMLLRNTLRSCERASPQS